MTPSCNPGVIAVAGRIRSGKSALTHRLSKLMLWRRVSFGGFLKHVAAAQGLSDTRESLQELGKQYVSDGVEVFVDRLLTHAQWKPGDPMVIDGIRHLSVLQALRDRVRPLPVVLVFIDLGEQERQYRLDSLGLPASETVAWDQHPTELDVVIPDRLRMNADFVVDGDQATEDMAQMVLAWAIERLA